MAAVSFRLLPETAEIGPDGGLVVGGCRLTDLAAEFGTPLLVYDEVHLRRRCRQARRAFDGPVIYATKAFLCRSLAKLVDEAGLGFDFSTAGEMAVLADAGVNPDKWVFHGNNKSEAELAAAVEAGAGRIVIDSTDEIDRLERLVNPGLPPPKVLLRLTPGVEVQTHEYIATGADGSKFGLTISTGAATEAIHHLQQLPSLELVGFHAHVGSQVFDLDAFGRAARTVIDFVKHHDLPELSLGGGLGVAYTDDDPAPTFADWAKALADAASAAGFQRPIGVEPGRSLVATAGLSLYTVGTVKDLPGLRTYISVDGGMSDNIRPALYGSRYEAFLPARVSDGRSRPVRVVGKHCESGDILVADGRLPAATAVGDILAMPVTGAYGYSMASTYNRLPRPAVVFVAAGRVRVVLRRETIDDLSRLEA